MIGCFPVEEGTEGDLKLLRFKKYYFWGYKKDCKE
jgi:hypothetical protein